RQGQEGAPGHWRHCRGVPRIAERARRGATGDCLMTRFLHLSRRAIIAWANWRSKRAMHRAYPELAVLDVRERKCRKQHKRGSAAIIRAKREIVHADLAAKLFP